MKPHLRVLVAAAALAILLCIPGCGPAAPPAPSGTLTGRVVSVADGDTLTIRSAGGERVRVRLWGVDAPERSQLFAERAREFTREMVLDREVRVTVRDTDEHGRTVGEVWVGERSLNAALVEEGLAWAFRRYSERFVPEEEAARSAGRGLWSEREAQPPWEWRSERRSAPLPSAGGVRQ